MLTHRDGHGSELVSSEPEYPVAGHNRNSTRRRAPAPAI